MKNISEKMFFFFFGALLILFFARAKQCRNVKESNEERMERKCLELSWQKGYLSALKDLEKRNQDSFDIHLNADVQYILKTYK